MELRILSGLHRGAAMELEEGVGPLAIGSSPESDVLLADPGIAATHARVTRQDQHWQFGPGSGQVFDAQGQPVKTLATIERGSRFRVGAIWIAFAAEEDPWNEAPSPAATPQAAATATGQSRYPRLKTSMAAGLVAATLLPMTLWLISSTANGNVDPQAGRAAKYTQQAKALSADAPASAASAASALPSATQLAEEFTRTLVERELFDKLELRLTLDLWEIRGSLDAEEQVRLERLLVQFTKANPTGVPIEVTLGSPADQLPFKVVEVISGKSANIVTQDGERLYVGDTREGYRLSAVEATKLVFVGKRRVEVPL